MVNFTCAFCIYLMLSKIPIVLKYVNQPVYFDTKRRGLGVERQTPDPKVVGSNPAQGGIFTRTFHSLLRREYLVRNPGSSHRE